MAVFGFQLMLTIIVLSLLNKLSIRYSFARWLLTKGGLFLYLHPSNEQLKESISAQNKSDSKPAKNDGGRKSFRHRKNRNHIVENNEKETFNVPRDIEITLEREPLNLYYLVQLPYYNELQWLIDFSFCTIFVYLLTEIYYFVFNTRANQEYNLSVVWCLLSLGFVIKILLSITGKYFRGGDESIGERSMCIVSGCLFFLVSMFVLIVDEELLEFGLIKSYRSFSKNAIRLLEYQGVIEYAQGPSSFLMLKFWLAIWCGLIGAFFTFPGMRVAKMHKDALEHAKDNRVLQILYNMTFISPLFAILLWVKPVARHYLTVRDWPNRGTLMSSETFESFRLLFIIAIIVFRLLFFRRYLQSYLRIAEQKLESIQKESGRITNLNLQKSIAYVSSYFCVASLQFLTPILMCLFITLLTKSTGDYTWSFSLPTVTNSVTSQTLNDTIIHDFVETDTNSTVNDDIDAEVTLTLLKNVFNSTVLRGVNGFMLWWTTTTWFATSTIGFVYYSYFQTR